MRIARWFVVSSVVLWLVWASAASAQSPIGTGFTYQGQLKQDGLPVTAPAMSMRFRLWTAETGGTAGDFVIVSGVEVQNGLFTVNLDFGEDVFEGTARWLEVQIFLGGTRWAVLSPRQEITATPYALYARTCGEGGSLWEVSGDNVYYNDGFVGIGTDTPNRRLHVVDNTTSPAAMFRNEADGNALRVESAGANGTALRAAANQRAIDAWAYNEDASAIWGGSVAETGTGSGVFGYGSSIDGRGVSGEAIGENGFGVYGYASSEEGDSAGVYGISASEDGHGVWGVAGATSGSAEGGRFETDAPYGRGVYGVCNATTGSNYGVLGVVQSPSGVGVYGAPQATSGSTIGVRGTTRSPTGIGVKGQALVGGGTNYGVYGSSVGGANSAGVYAYNEDGYGAIVTSDTGYSLKVEGTGGIEVVQTAGSANTAGLDISTTGSEEPVGVRVNVEADYGKLAEFNLSGATGYYGPAFTITGDCLGNVLRIHSRSTDSEADSALYARADGQSSAIYGYNSRDNDDAPGVEGYHVMTGTNWGIGVRGVGGHKGVVGYTEGNSSRYALYGEAKGSFGAKYGVYGRASGTETNYGVYGSASGGTTNYAGYFQGNVHVTGTLSKGGGSFKIDHPLDPENKYLCHSFVESPDMMNIYNGNVVLDKTGSATITMPEWFEALNMEFRYQLTCIGGFAQVYVAREIENNQFQIAGGTPGLKVSWQVTGVRQDAFAKANRIPVEVVKPQDEKGSYLHPEAFGKSADVQVDTRRAARAEAKRQESLTAEADAADAAADVQDTTK